MKNLLKEPLCLRKQIHKEETVTVIDTPDAVSFSDWNVHDPEPDAGARSDFLMRGAHITTPAERGKTHYFWAAAFDMPGIAPELTEQTRVSVTAAFDEDKHLLEKLQSQAMKDPRGVAYPEINLRADGAGIRVRRVLKKKLEAERGG